MDYSDFEDRMSEYVFYKVANVFYSHEIHAPSTEEIYWLINEKRRDIFNVLEELRSEGLVKSNKKSDIVYNKLTGRGMSYCERFFEQNASEFKQAYDHIDWPESLEEVREENVYK